MKKIEYQIPAMKVVKLNSRPNLLVGSPGGETPTPGGGGF
jgi:hypothetical protein